ncbi:tyrosine-type recombinase/integrase [Tolypothrix sp. VBCCA 56010]|uniref:tyrosine-type recombinase/integrase n=1 Tax=Tolypothrix sp. VBCCA 56010 TaxID=3137731 RepID=UPI003D7E2E52
MSPLAIVQIKERKQLAKLAPADAQVKLIQMWLHGKAPKSIKAYQFYVTDFLAFLGKPLLEVTLEDLYDYADHLLKLGLAPNTQKTRLYAVKSLISFAHTIGFLPFNVATAMKLKKTADTLNERLLATKEVQKIVWATEMATYRYQGEKQRDLLILKLLYTAGLRVSELTQLTWGDLTERDRGGQVTVVGKGDKTRSVLLPVSLWAELMEFRGSASDGSPVFKSRKGGGHLDRSQINRIVEAAAKRALVNKKVSPHWLRHAHATHALESGADIGLVQKTLGHDNVATTSRYLQARPDDSSAMYVPTL